MRHSSKLKQQILEHIFLFTLGFCAYPTIEMVYRGVTHVSMAFAGGMGLMLINLICCKPLKTCNIFLRLATGALLITLVEFCTGVIVNNWFRLNIWDYSTLPLNLIGQICLPYTALWFLLAIPSILICEFYHCFDRKIKI